MLSLLEAAKPYTEYFSGIRLSTRPDYIDDEILVLLKKYSVKTIELGAQSMNDEVLAANSRGHSSEDVVKSSELIKSYGFKLGLQMMTGLFMSDAEKDIGTARRFISIRPDCVRIYPTVIMRGTDLFRYYSEGLYTPYSLEESVELVSKLLLMFYDEKIDVIRVGLHYSDSLAENDVARNYHPAFKELCENRIFFNKMIQKLQFVDNKEIDIIVNPSSLSKAIGQKRSNLLYLEKNGYNIHYIKDPSLDKYDIVVKEHR